MIIWTLNSNEFPFYVLFLSKGKEDMVSMEIINDAELLFNLAARYRNNLIFTYVGPTLLVINPF
jgi:myosin heavy subunit